MRLVLFIFFLLPVFFVSAQVAEVESLIHNYVESLPVHAEVSIAYVENGKVYRYGYQVGEHGPEAVNNFDRLYEIGSITKTFTTSLLMHEVHLGKMQLEDPIQEYLPVQMKGDSFDGHTITLLDLATHTSGLSTSPDNAGWPYIRAKIFTPQNPNRNFKAKHYYKYLEDFELDYIPGQVWEYNNFAMALLGDLIARKNNSTWEVLVKKWLFDPLGMSNSYFRIEKAQEDIAVQGYNEKGKKTARWEMDFIANAGGINSSLNDMLRWMDANLHVVSEDLAFIHDGHDELGQKILFNDGYWFMGIGWWHRLKDDPYQTIYHSGGTGGFTTIFGFDKERQKGVIILTNFAYDHPQMRTADDLNKTYEMGRTIMTLED
ncbi:MAG: beta-lactamase family protein [Saprospiraceae bacterium]|nr:beta-lactamase family protein [Saprospiraceae bacterium]